MLSIIFIVALVWGAVKMLIWGIKAAWGIARVLAVIVLLPLFIIGLAWIGLFYMAIAVLIIAGIVTLLEGSEHMNDSY